MKVLQVSKFYPPIMGGIEAVAWELAEGLHQAGVRSSVLCSHDRWPGAHDAGHIEVWRSGSLGRLMSTSMAPAMPWLLRRHGHDADIVHLHMPDPMAAAALWLARPKGRVVVHWHSDVIRQRRALKLYEPLQRWVLDRADAVIATSEPYALASAPLQAWRHKVAVVPIGITDNRHAVRQDVLDRVRQGLRGRRFVFALGRMTYYKGFDVLIEAASLLPDDCAVIIGGDGDHFDDFRHRIAARGLAGKVQLPGHIPDDELPSYFAACDVFCMPSTVRAEAYGVAMLEAMIMGRPVVATEIEGSGVSWVNVHGQTGLNVPVLDAEALAAALRRVLAEPELHASMAGAARQRYEREFTAALMTRRVLDLYRGLLAST